MGIGGKKMHGLIPFPAASKAISKRRVEKSPGKSSAVTWHKEMHFQMVFHFMTLSLYGRELHFLLWGNLIPSLLLKYFYFILFLFTPCFLLDCPFFFKPFEQWLQFGRSYRWFEVSLKCAIFQSLVRLVLEIQFGEIFFCTRLFFSLALKE